MRIFQDAYWTKSTVMRVCTMAVCIMVSVAKTEAKDFFSAPQEKNLLTCSDGTVLRGMYYETSRKVKGFTASPQYNSIMVKDENGVCRICDYKTLEVMSELKSEPTVVRDGYFLVEQGKASYYSCKNEKLWTANGAYLYYTDTLGIAVCMNGRSVNNGHLEGWDVKTGNMLWKATVPYRYHNPWNDRFNVKDSPNSRFLIADSLYLLDTKTGALTVRAFYPSVKGLLGRLTGTHSRLVQSGDSLFIADAKNLYCYNLSLEEIWRTPLPEGMGSKSELKLRGDKLYLMNFGVGYQKDFAIRTGKAFYATYDKSTGRQLQLGVPKMDKKKLRGVRYVPGKVYLYDRPDIYYVDEGSEEAHKIEWTPKTTGMALDDMDWGVIYDTVYVKRNGMLEPLATNDQQLVVEVNDYDVNVVNIASGEVTKYHGSQVFFHDYRNVYSTNNTKAHSYVIVDDKTMKILYDFNYEGICGLMPNGDIWLYDNHGVGVIRAK